MDSTVSENGGIANLPPNDLASTPDDWAGEIGEDGAPGNSATPGQITDDMIPEDVPSGPMRPNRIESLDDLTEAQTERLNYAKMLGMNGFRILELRVGSKKPVGGRGWITGSTSKSLDIMTPAIGHRAPLGLPPLKSET